MQQARRVRCSAGMKLSDTGVGTMRNIIMASSTDQVVMPYDGQTLQLDRDIRPKYRAFVKQAMGGRDSFDVRELDARLNQILRTLESADGLGFLNLHNRKYNEAELRWAAKRDPAVIPFVELTKETDKLGV